jgi:hypothetical protein
MNVLVIFQSFYSHCSHSFSTSEYPKFEPTLFNVLRAESTLLTTTHPLGVPDHCKTFPNHCRTFRNSKFELIVLNVPRIESTLLATTYALGGTQSLENIHKYPKFEPTPFNVLRVESTLSAPTSTSIIGLE